MEVTSSSDTLVPLYQCKWYHVPEYRDIRTHHLEFTQSVHRQRAPVNIDCIKVTSLTRNMTYHEYFPKNLSSALVVIFDTSETLSLTWGFWVPYITFISSRFTCLWGFQMSIFHEYYGCQFRQTSSCIQLFFSETFLFGSLSRDILVSFVRLSSLSNPRSCLTKVPFGTSIILNSDLNNLYCCTVHFDNIKILFTNKCTLLLNT